MKKSKCPFKGPFVAHARGADWVIAGCSKTTKITKRKMVVAGTPMTVFIGKGWSSWNKFYNVVRTLKKLLKVHKSEREKVTMTNEQKEAAMRLARTMTLSEAIKKCKEPCPQCGSEPGDCADEGEKP